MRTTDLFKNTRSAKRINESIEKTFGKRLNLESFDLPKLEDARNKLRTQIHDARSQSGFNENLENETLTQAQWMLDAINSEIAEREEFVADAGPAEVEEGSGSLEEKVAQLLQRFEQDAMEIGGYGDPDIKKIVQYLEKGDAESAAEVVWYAYTDQDGGEFPQKEPLIDDLQADFEELVQGSNEGVQIEGSMDELAAELGQIADDEDYDKLYDLLSDDGPVGDYLQDKIQEITFETGLHPKDDFEQIETMLMDIVQQEFGGQNDDEGGETDDNYAMASAGFGSDEDYESINNEAGQKRHQPKSVQTHDKLARRGAMGTGQIAKYPDEYKAMRKGNRFTDMYKINGPQGRLPENQEVAEKAVSKSQQQAAGIALAARRKGETPSGKGAAAEMSKMSMKELEKFAGTKHKNLPAKKDESVETGEDMTKLHEGEIQQASAIVTAKTMVDRVGRWIEELSGMENDTLLQLGDSIRDEMGSEQAKNFISAVAPAIQAALENLKATRETLSTGVRTLTGEEQPANMLGGEPAAGGMDDLEAPAAPDAMNMEPEGDIGDEFAAAEPAAGGLGDSGREQRESINYQNRLLNILAG
jgi:hypothetical protein